MLVKIKKGLEMIKQMKKWSVEQLPSFLKSIKGLLRPTPNFLVFGCGPRLQSGSPLLI